MNARKASMFVLALAVALITADAAQAALSVGQSIGVDFADGPGTPGAGAETNFNIMTTPATIDSVIDTTANVVAGVSIQLHNGNGAMGEANLGFGAAGVGDYTGTPFSDLSFNDGIWRSGSISVTFSGLDDGLIYQLHALSAGPLNQDREVFVDVNGTIQSQFYNDFRANNVLTPLTFTNVTTDGDGKIAVEFSVASSAVAANALYLTAVDTIPEPASMTLVGMGALLLLRRSRTTA